MSKENFKEFVKKNPNLVKYVNSNDMTWQKFYEMYDMYGEENDVWKTYMIDNREVSSGKKQSTDFMNYFKNINVDSVQESINSIQRVLGVLGDLGVKSSTSTSSTYEPKPIYKHFDD
jgi:hypothetical protein